MIYQIKAPILGFEHITSIELTRLDEHFAKITSQDKSLEMMLVNPYSLREYSSHNPALYRNAPTGLIGTLACLCIALSSCKEM